MCQGCPKMYFPMFLLLENADTVYIRIHLFCSKTSIYKLDQMCLVHTYKTYLASYIIDYMATCIAVKLAGFIKLLFSIIPVNFRFVCYSYQIL